MELAVEAGAGKVRSQQRFGGPRLERRWIGRGSAGRSEHAGRVPARGALGGEGPAPTRRPGTPPTRKKSGQPTQSSVGVPGGRGREGGGGG